MTDQELEVKFCVSDLDGLAKRLEGLGARLAQPRVHEMNLRFDTPDGALGRGYQVLRLRQDTATRLTYKGPGELQEGVRVRTEIEFAVSDFEAARRLFMALGYRVSMFYEKYRATYTLADVLVTLDEMPYGNFIEVEGPDPAMIRLASDRLGLDWEARILDSYTSLFDRLRVRRGLPFNDLSFANFEPLSLSPQDLGVRLADRPPS